jgi:hypothetical protein
MNAVTLENMKVIVPMPRNAISIVNTRPPGCPVRSTTSA